MKLYLLLYFIIFLGVGGQAQTSATNGTGGGYYDIAGTYNPSGVPSAGVLVILAGDELIVDGNFYFNGDIEVYGTLTIEKSGGNKGRLIMDANSTISLAPGSNLQATGGSNATFIQIGGAQLRGSDLNTVNEPNELDESNLAGGGCDADPNCTFTPLPIELLYLKAHTLPQGIDLQWASSSESNFSHYQIERSNNGGQAFDAIGVVEAATANSTSQRTYRWLDDSPVYGANYYRLRAVDIDGTSETHGLVMAYAGTDGSLRVSPNPARGDVVKLNYAGVDGNTRLSIRDSQGREIMEIKLNELTTLLPVSSFKPGVYLLQVRNTFETKSARLSIQ